MVDRFRRGNKDDEGDDRPEGRRPGSKPPSDKPDKDDDKSGRRFGPPSFGRGGDDKDKKDDKPGDSSARRLSSPGDPAGGPRRPSGVGGGGNPSGGSSDESSQRRLGSPSFGRGGDDKGKEADKDAGSRPGFGGFRRPGAGDEKKEEDEGGSRRFGALGRGRPGEEEKKDDKPGDRPGSSAGRPGFGGDRPAGGGGSPFNRDREADSGGRPGASPQSPRSTSTFGASRDAEGGGAPGNRPFGGGGGGSPFNRDKEEKDESGSPSGRSFGGGGGGSSFGRDRDADSGGGRPGGDRPGGGGGSPFNRDRDADSGGGGRPGGGSGSSFNRDRDADSGGGRPSGGGSPFSRDRDADSGGGGRPGGDRPGGSSFGRDRDADSGGGRPGGGGSPLSSGGPGGRPTGSSGPSSQGGSSLPGRAPFGGSSEGAGGRPAPQSSIASPARPGSSPPARTPALPGRPGSKPAEVEPPKRGGLPGFGGRKDAPPDTPKKGDAKPKDDDGRRLGLPFGGRKSSPEEDKKRIDDRRRKEEPPKRGTVEVKKDPKAAAKTSRATTTAARLPERDTGIRNVTHGLDYNRKLDMAGWLLVGAALILLAGVGESIASSDPKGFTYDLDQFLAQIFGLGRIVIPVTSFILGFWLIARNFGRVLEIDYFRILGFGVLLATLLSTLQWWELMWVDFPKVNEVPTIEALEAQSQALWEDGGGGGLIGHTLYMFLQHIFWDIGVPVVLVISWGLGTMFAFDLSFEKMATNIRTTRANRQAKREAALARYAESKGLITPAASVTPAPSAPAMAVAAAVLATDESTGPQRNVGKATGRTTAPAVVVEQTPLPAATATVVAAEAPAGPKEKRGMFGRRKEDAPTDKPITADTDGDAPKRAEKEGGLFGRRKDEAPSDKPITADTDGDAPKRAERAGGLFGRRKEDAPTNKPITADTDGDAPKRALPAGITASREPIETAKMQGSDQPNLAQPEGEDTGPRRPLPSFGGRSASPEGVESKDKPVEQAASVEPEGARRRLPGLPGRRTESGDTGPIATSAVGEVSSPVPAATSTPAMDESSSGRRLPGLRPSFGRQAPPADTPDSAKPAVAESTSKSAVANEAAPTAEDQAGRRRFGVPALPGRKAPEPEKPAETGTGSASTAAAVVAGMAAADASKQPGQFGRRGTPETPDAKPADVSPETVALKPVAAEPEKSAAPVFERSAQPVAPRRGLPDLTPAERAMLGGESASTEKPNEPAFEKPAERSAEAVPVVAESPMPETPKSEAPESVEAVPSESAPASPETLAPVRRGFPQFTAAEAAMMGVAAATSISDAPKDDTVSEVEPPSSGRRPMTAPPRDLPGRQPAESGGLFGRSAERTPPPPPPPALRRDQPESVSNEDTQVVETNATQPIVVPSDTPTTPSTEPPRRSSPFARPTGDAPLFRPRATSEVSVAASGDAEKSETGEPTVGLSANPVRVAMAGAALADELSERQSDSSELPPALADQPAQPRGLPIRPTTEPIARERPVEGGDEAAARLSHFQRAFGGDAPAGEPPQRANFVPRREPLGRATGERPAIATPPTPPVSTEAPAPADADEDAGAMQPAQPRFARQNPFDQPEGDMENIVPPVRAIRPTPLGRPVSRPPQIGGANPDLDKMEITDGGGEEETPARASLVPFAARRDHPSIVQPHEDIDDEDEDDDEDEVPAVVAPPAAARRHEPEAEPPAESKSEGNGSSKWLRPDFMTVLEEGSEQKIDQEILLERAQIIEETLDSFGAPGKVIEVNTGPVITQFGVEPDYVEKRGGQRSRVKVSAIAALDRDLALALAAKSIRIEAPVPGKGFVGIEVPNAESAVVSLRDVMSSDYHQHKVAKSKLAIGLGRRVDGAPISADLTEMPHLLIAGATGSGKSVCVNAIISCLLLQNTPDELQMIMVDPKRVELAGYNGLPHLVAPVVVDLERIVGVLKWVQREMDDRYKRFAALGARNIQDFNRKRPQEQPQMPYLVVIVDELADLMMLAPDETERLVARLAQMARATGIHLIISTQRPSVDVVTGLIKANFPARIAFAVASSVDSRVIIDQPGAEKLLGRGDMLFQAPDSAAPLRMQGVYLSDNEINRITSYWKSTRALKGGKGSQPERPAMSSSPLDEHAKPVGVGRRPDGGPIINDRRAPATGQPVPPGGNGERRQDRQQTFWEEVEEAEMDSDDDAMEGVDDLYDEAVKLVRGRNKASISMLQRHFRIGYTRSARLIDLMEERGVVGPAESGAKPRLVIPDKEGGETT